jgi:protocatechuate 3,4-dioxygenase beta subunit
MMDGRLSILVSGVAVVVAGVVAAGQAQGPPQRPARDTSAQQNQSAAPAASGKISGRVLGSDNGRPVRRARVAINAPDLQGGRAMLTDDSGVFSFTDLPASRYTVFVSKSGYVSLSYGQRRPLQAGTPLQLADAQDLKGIDFRLPRGSVISGHVLDENGDPMPGTMVRVMMYQYAQGNRQLVPAGNGQTDDRGEYRVWGLNPGDYYVSAIMRNLNINPGRGGLSPGARGGPPPPGVPAGVGQVLDALAARGLGAFSSDPAPDDESQLAYAPTYYPGVASPGEARAITVGLSAEVLGIDFNILLVRTGRVGGRVTNADGSAATGGNVNLMADVAGGRGGALGGAYGGRIDGDGGFQIANVPPGRYILRATGGGGRGRGGRGGFGGGQDLPQYAAMPLAVDGDVDGVLVTLGPGATIAGTITVRATQTAVLPDVTQFRILAPPTDNANFGPNGNARVNADGTFTLEGVATGSHWLRAQGGRGWSLNSVTVDGRETIDTPIEVRSGQRVTGVNLTFTDKQSEINGSVTDQQGTPITEYTVLAFPADSALWRPQARQIMTTRPDQNGKYQLRGLPPGNYYLAAVDPEKQGEWFEPDFLEQHRAGAARVNLGEGDIKTQDFKVTVR